MQKNWHANLSLYLLLFFLSNCKEPSFQLRDHESPGLQELSSNLDESNPQTVVDNQPLLPSVPPISPTSEISPDDQLLQEALSPRLVWESNRAPFRAEWSKIALRSIIQNFQDLDLVKDADRFCPNYYRAGRHQRINFWGQLIAAISFYESAWNPTTRFEEKTLGIDPVTGTTVFSEGLLQLSYQDQRWAPWCEFDWPRDQNLSPTDPRKTIFDPGINLRCGIGIMARQIRRLNLIVLRTGVYWAVIREEGRYQRIPQIAQMVQRAAHYCRE